MGAVTRLVNHVLKLSPPMEPQEIDRCHRIGPAQNQRGNTRKRPLLVKFSGYGSRARVPGLRRRLRNLARGEPLQTSTWPSSTNTEDVTEPTSSDGDGVTNADVDNEDAHQGEEHGSIDYDAYINNHIYFNEDLTKIRAQLAKETRKLRKDHKISDTWVYDGKILIKKKNGHVEMVNKIEDLNAYA